MSFHPDLANILIGVSIIVMLFTIISSNQLIGILKQSKVEGFWKRSRIFLAILAFLFLMIMLTRLIGADSSITADLASGPNHAIIMNATFLITAILLFSMVKLDIQTYESLFSILKQDSKIEKVE